MWPPFPPFPQSELSDAMTEAFNQICYSERGGEDCASTQMCVHMAMQSYAFAEANSTENGTSIEEDLYLDYYDPEDFMRNPGGEGLIEREGGSLIEREGGLIEGEVTDPPSLREAPLREAPHDRELDVSLNSRSVEGMGTALLPAAAVGVAASTALLLILAFSRLALRRACMYSSRFSRHRPTTNVVEFIHRARPAGVAIASSQSHASSAVVKSHVQHVMSH